MQTGNGIGWAINQMDQGHYVCRSGWNGKGMYLTIIDESNLTAVSGTYSTAGAEYRLEPFVMMKTAQDNYIPWLCSQADLLANDWMLSETQPE